MGLPKAPAVSRRRQDRTVCISQPMLFPWVGMLEQMQLSDVYVHYDDVQFVRQGFTRRVQLKTDAGMRWMIVPVRNLRQGITINAMEIDDDQPWRERHLSQLTHAYARAPFLADMLRLVEQVYAPRDTNLCSLVVSSMHAVADYLGLCAGTRVLFSSRLATPGSGSERIRDIVQRCEGNAYITGHGARHYLDHALLESEGIRVGYMDYQMVPYPQLHGPFTPFVSSLDLIANCGREGRRYVCSGTMEWRRFLAR